LGHPSSLSILMSWQLFWIQICLKLFAHIHVKLFADDVKLYLQILNYEHVLQLLQAVDALVACAKEWQLSISVNKRCVLNIAVKSLIVLASVLTV